MRRNRETGFWERNYCGPSLQPVGYWGFTLIEMLLALSIFALMATAVYGTLSGGLSLNRRSAGDNRIYQEIKWSLDLMTKDLENVLAYDMGHSYADRNTFVGEPSQVSFVASKNGSLKAVRYYLGIPQGSYVHRVVVGGFTKAGETIVSNSKETTNNKFLIREEEDFVAALADETGNPGDWEILSSHVKSDSLRFSYAKFKEDPNEEFSEIVWEDSWESPQVPFGIKVSLTFLPPGEKSQEISLQKIIYIPTGFRGTDE